MLTTLFGKRPRQTVDERARALINVRRATATADVRVTVNECTVSAFHVLVDGRPWTGIVGVSTYHVDDLLVLEGLYDESAVVDHVQRHVLQREAST